jgi:DNA-binding MarR family transcriptional regulator
MATEPEPRWLSAVEQRAWRGWIDAARRIETATERQLKDDSGLSSDDYEVMVRLSEAPDRSMRMSELATCVANSPSRLSQRIDRMERAGLVCRLPCEHDGRVLHAHLTDEGYARLEAAAPGHVHEVRRQFVDRLNADEIEFLADILPRLAQPPDG